MWTGKHLELGFPGNFSYLFMKSGLMVILLHPRDEERRNLVCFAHAELLKILISSGS